MLSGLRRARVPESSELLVAIMRVHRVQTWFQRYRGVAMTRRDCFPCGKERLFTIWSDGRYHCLSCFYEQVKSGRPGPVQMITDASVMEEFSASWKAYVRRVEAFEDPWTPPGGSALIRLNRITPPQPPPVCEVGACAACEGLRPFMRREDGDAGCISCLMQGRIVEFEIEVADDHVAA